ncbi:hypothetical protein [Sediminibacterium soli]|uniref:hypothetical protein n=1 Tax=Sediminibacterium soli TaxID=2698829 RepID=UPI001379E255|nr:hypothetical protein [Sediminibacterium soli]NCI48093.1 hypothetical protein [Sediminibacterium soli]
MSNDEQPQSSAKFIVIAVIVISVFIFIFYVAGEALNGIANGMNKIPIWLLIPLVIATIYIAKKMIDGKK